MSIGLVMFCKALIVGLWSVFVERWQAFRKRRSEIVVLHYSKRRDRYEAFDWHEVVEVTATYTRKAMLGLVFLWWIFLAYVVASGDVAVFFAVLNFIAGQ